MTAELRLGIEALHELEDALHQIVAAADVLESALLNEDAPPRTHASTARLVAQIHERASHSLQLIEKL